MTPIMRICMKKARGTCVGRARLSKTQLCECPRNSSTELTHSTCGADMLFVKQYVGGLHPCIEYGGITALHMKVVQLILAETSVYDPRLVLGCSPGWCPPRATPPPGLPKALLQKILRQKAELFLRSAGCCLHVCHQ